VTWGSGGDAPSLSSTPNRAGKESGAVVSVHMPLQFSDSTRHVRTGRVTERARLLAPPEAKEGQRVRTKSKNSQTRSLAVRERSRVSEALVTLRRAARDPTTGDTRALRWVEAARVDISQRARVFCCVHEEHKRTSRTLLCIRHPSILPKRSLVLR